MSDGNGGANYDVTYATVTTGAITTKELTVTGLTGTAKTYDGTTDAAATGTAALSGIVGGDTVTLGGTPVYTFVSRNIGTPVSIGTTGYTIGGTHAANYHLTQPTLSANITRRAITVTAATGTKVYDGTTSSAGTPTITSGSDRKSTRLNSSHVSESRMPSSA